MKKLTLSLVLALASTAWAQSGVWQAKFVAGPSWLGGRDVQMMVTPERLTVENTRRAGLRPLVVPISAVREIIYSRTEFNRGQAISGGPLVSGNPPDGLAAANAAYLMAIGIASGMHGRKHYISVEWEEDGVEQELMVEVPKDTAPELIGVLEKVAGPKWMNMERRCLKVMDRINLQRDKAFVLELREQANIQIFHLAPGTYKAVLLEGQSNSGELYLFSNSVEQTNLRAIAQVDIEPPITGITKPEVRLSQPSKLAEVLTAENTLRVR